MNPDIEEFAVAISKLKDACYDSLVSMKAEIKKDVNDVYTIKAFGRDLHGKSICLSMNDFKPYFYIKVPDFWNRNHANALKTRLEELCTDSSISDVKLIKRMDFWGFTNEKLFNFARIDFDNYDSFKRVKNTIDYGRNISINGKEYSNLRLYEANIDPFIRLIHIKNILPSGWIRVPRSKITESVLLPSTCSEDVECSWKDVEAAEGRESVAPFRIASFDIECMSSHGDFPMPMKNYRKSAIEVTDLYKKWRGEAKDIVEVVRKGMYDMFDIHGGDGSCSRVYTKEPVSDLKRLKRRIDSAVDDIAAMLSTNIDDREACVSSLVKKFDAIGLPSLAGDEIIAIGMTVHSYGSKECDQKYILTLKSCDAIDGVDVRTFECEKALLLEFRKLVVQEVDPDIVTGYNINGFDFWYLNQRAVELDAWEEMSALGRIKERRCKYVEQRLSSSALGDNLLRYIDMNGRVVLDVMKVVQRDHKLDSYKLDLVAEHFLGKKKHDVSPQDIFRLQRGSSKDRKVIADYCVQDCALCNYLIMKLEILANNIGMSNVCLVPLHYIFMRGQGIKIFSLVMKVCKDSNYLIPVIKPARGKDGELQEEDDSYEGAIVLEPKTGIYIDEPVTVMDYASLYPSCMISENISHNCIVRDPKYDNIPGVEYLNVSYDVYDDAKNKVGERVCRYAQPRGGERGLIPRILQKLLDARKATRKQMQMVALNRDPTKRGWYSADKRELRLESGNVISDVSEDEVGDAYQQFQKAVLDGLQSAYKVTANSLYGQCGARTSPIHMKDIAACTTATGRRMILKAKAFMEKNYDANVIYGDTDSIFVIFPQKNGEKCHAAIKPSMDMANEASKAFQKVINDPHNLENEKTFWPFILLSKKRYVGNKYEGNDSKFKQNSMGIVLKRRDNAPIVKTVFGGLIDIILNNQDVTGSVDFLKTQLQRMETNMVDLTDLVITKSLRADYKDPDKIAHKVLAERMGDRDPGNKPQVNDRIPYVYIQTKDAPKGKKILQGDRIEHIDYVRKEKLKPDIAFYITNQVCNPVVQLLGIVVEQLPGYSYPANHFETTYKKLVKEGLGPSEARSKVSVLREKEVERLIFRPVLKRINDKKNGVREITHWFRPLQ